jgi:hypothetical protein
MSRPKKATVDYFPHYVNHGKTVKIIQHLYGNDGFSFFYQLMELLCRSNGHYYHCKNIEDKEFLASETHNEWDFCTQILGKLAEMKIIDPDLWEIGVIWMQSLVDSVRDAYKKRQVSVPEIPPIAGFLVPEIPQAGCISGADNPQSKVKESITPLPPLPDSPPQKPPKLKRVKVSVDYDLEIKKALEAFSPDMRTPVQAFVAVVASLNKTQTISQSRELSLLGELSGVSAATTPDVFRYAILEATTRKKDNVGYIKAIIKRRQTEGDTGSGNGNGAEAAPRAAPTAHFYENRDQSWTRVDPSGEERRVTRADMEAERRATAPPPQDPRVMKLVQAIAGAT